MVLRAQRACLLRSRCQYSGLPDTPAAALVEGLPPERVRLAHRDSHSCRESRSHSRFRYAFLNIGERLADGIEHFHGLGHAAKDLSPPAELALHAFLNCPCCVGYPLNSLTKDAPCDSRLSVPLLERLPRSPHCLL